MSFCGTPWNTTPSAKIWSILSRTAMSNKGGIPGSSLGGLGEGGLGLAPAATASFPGERDLRECPHPWSAAKIVCRGETTNYMIMCSIRGEDLVYQLPHWFWRYPVKSILVSVCPVPLYHSELYAALNYTIVCPHQGRRLRVTLTPTPLVFELSSDEYPDEWQSCAAMQTVHSYIW